ncbi:Cof-type HAD-IIB family hydrolase [Clostridium beijerinckii]|uniref:Cof-type HAD-IIB family hydrolase n=1 Tax=Clostridium beijerinckii TaxID=1520 RepID=UPI0002DC8C06|nr:Cof-type HAD-IIB family hydrolase [Clostridium beijerinckii]
MKIKLIALDLDGTVLNSCGYISDKTLTAIKMAIEKGVQVVLATGRSVGLICDEIKSIEEITYAISSNGAAVVNLRKNEIVFSNFITIDILKKIIEIIKDYPIVVEFYSNGNAYIDEEVFINPAKYGLSEKCLNLMLDNHNLIKNIFSVVDDRSECEWIKCVEKINIPFLKDDMKNEVYNSLLSINDRVKITSSVEDNLEINIHSANKGAGLEKLTELLEIDLKEIAAIGDNNNDIEMLQMAGIGIAMGNASEDIKARADFITLDNDRNGAAEAILQILDKNLQFS